MKHSYALLLSFILACGGGGGEAPEAGEPSGGEPAEAAAPAVDPAEAATITGTVAFEGEAPAGEPIDMSEEPTCADAHGETPMKSPVVVGAGGGLANVFVYVKEGLGDREFPTPSEGVLLDQQGCRYTPHIVAIQAGQELIIRNSDGVLHNINTQPSENRGFNISQPVTMDTSRDFSSPEVMIPVKCDVHGWVEGFIGVQSHPYMAVTGDDGSFEIANLPPGDYVVEAWHELYGVQTTSVTVAAQETQEIGFSYDAGMAGRRVPMGDPIDPHDHDLALAAGGE